jgi:hypothetical protein
MDNHSDGATHAGVASPQNANVWAPKPDSAPSHLAAVGQPCGEGRLVALRDRRTGNEGVVGCTGCGTVWEVHISAFFPLSEIENIKQRAQAERDWLAARRQPAA